MEPYKILVTLLSRVSIAVAEANNGDLIAREFIVKTYDDVRKLPGYEAAFAVVRELKSKVELIEGRDDKTTTAEDKLRLSLRLLAEEMKKSGPGANVEALDVFIRGGTMYQGWDSALKEAFETRSKIITGWLDFFVSYTRRDAAETNMRFSKLIKSVFALLPRPKELTQNNYVAQIIAKYLEGNNLRGFTDYKNIKCGDDIEDAVRTHCQVAFGLAQFIEHASFKTPAAPKLNWCFEEYKEYVAKRPALAMLKIEAGNKVYFLVGAEKADLLRPADLGPYVNWYGQIDAPGGGKKYVSLEGLAVMQLRAQIREIADEIIKTKKDIIEAVLAA